MKKVILILLTFLPFTFANAQMVEGLIVTTGATEQVFALSEIEEISFGDDGVTVVKTSDATVSFNNDEGWQFRFDQIEYAGLSFAVLSKEEVVAKVYDLKGVLIKETPLSKLSLSELEKGVYIIRFNGKSLKIQPENADFPIVVTDSGIVIDVRLEQPLNAPSPILVTSSGIVTEVRLLQS